MSPRIIPFLFAALALIACSSNPSARTSTSDAARAACEGATLTPPEGVTPPVLISQTRTDPGPSAPYASAQACAEIRVEVDGSVTYVRTIRSTNPEFTNVFRQAVLRWRYKPAELNGKAVPYLVLVSSAFRHY